MRMGRRRSSPIGSAAGAEPPEAQATFKSHREVEPYRDLKLS